MQDNFKTLLLVLQGRIDKQWWGHIFFLKKILLCTARANAEIPDNFINILPFCN